MSNKNARINTRIDRTGKLRTETTRRDDGALDFAITTDERNNSTRVYFDRSGRADGFALGGSDLVLNGHEARTLYRALQRHFASQGKYFY